MELNFSSVETIPGLNASAAFQVDSGKVFKEDTDIVPVIVDDTLSYVPWGGDNMMPYNILKLIEDDEPSARQSLQHESLRQLWCANSKPLSNCRQTLAGHSRPARHCIDGRGAANPAISAVPKLLVQAERRVKLA